MGEKLGNNPDMSNLSKEPMDDVTEKIHHVEGGAMESLSQRHRESLKASLDRITPKSLADFLKKIKDRALEDNKSRVTTDYAMVSRAVEILEQLKSLKDWDKVFDRLAVKDVAELDNAKNEAGSIHILFGDYNNENEDIKNIENALYLLSKTVDYYAQAHFPVSYKKQLDQLSDRDMEKMKEVKEKLDKIDVS